MWTTDIENIFFGLDARGCGYLDHFAATGSNSSGDSGRAKVAKGGRYTDSGSDQDSDDPNRHKPSSTKHNRAKSHRFTFEDWEYGIGADGNSSGNPKNPHIHGARERTNTASLGSDGSGKSRGSQGSSRLSSRKDGHPPLTPRPTGDTHDSTHLVRDFLSLTLINTHIVCDASASDEAVYTDVLSLDLGPQLGTAFHQHTADHGTRNLQERLRKAVLDHPEMREVPVHRDAMGGVFSLEADHLVRVVLSLSVIAYLSLMHIHTDPSLTLYHLLIT